MAKVRFNFNNVTRRWMREWRQVTSEIMQIGVLLNTPARADLTVEEMRTLQAGIAEASGRLDGLEATRDRLLAEVLVEVPRDWLSDKAPTGLNWSDPASLDWLLFDKYEQLLVAMMEDRAGNSKN